MAGHGVLETVPVQARRHVQRRIQRIQPEPVVDRPTDGAERAVVADVAERVAALERSGDGRGLLLVLDPLGQSLQIGRDLVEEPVHERLGRVLEDERQLQGVRRQAGPAQRRRDVPAVPRVLEGYLLTRLEGVASELHRRSPGLGVGRGAHCK